MKGWRNWVGRVAFALSVLALLGTSLPRWEMKGKLEGPDRAPTDDHALRLTIEASHEPSYTFSAGGSPHVEGRRCTAGWRSEQKKVECLLPPGAKLGSVTISEKCKSSGGCCSNEPCKPPSDAFLDAKTEVVPIWKRVVEKESRLRIGKTISKDAGHTVVQHLQVAIENPLPNLQVTLRAKDTKGTVAGWSGAETNVECRWFDADAGKPLECTGFMFSSESSSVIDLDVIVKATAYGACDADAGACKPPPEADALRIVDAFMKAD